MQRRLLHKLFSLLSGLFILTSLIQTSCKGSRTNLSHAESLLETNPAAADSILCSMPEPQSRRDRAWYAVLKTQADYKQYKPITSDSLILTATDYYSAHRKSYRSAMAWYTQGCVYKEMKDDVAATESYLRAIDLFPDTLIRYYVLTEMSLAKCYLDKYMYDESLSLYNCCRNSAIRDADSTVLSYVDYQIALIKMFKQQFQGLDTAFFRLYHDKNLSDFYRGDCLLELAKFHIWHTCQFDSALFYLDKYRDYVKKPLQGIYYNLTGNVYSRMDNIEEAYSCYLSSTEKISDIYTLTDSYKNLSLICLTYGNSKEAFEYGKLYAQGLDSIRILNNANDVAIIRIAYNADKELLKRKEYRKRAAIMCIAVLLIILLLLYGLYFNHLNSIKRRYIRFCDNVWTTINTPIKENSSESDLLFYGKTKYLNSPSHHILFDNKRDTLILNKDAKAAILHDLNIAFSDLIVRIISRDSSINNRDIQVCLLCYLGVDNRSVCDIMNITGDNYRKIKSRMKDKLADSYLLYFR